MNAVQLQFLSMSQAEVVIAEIFTWLEEYDVPTPEMVFSYHGRSRVSIAMCIDDPIAMNIVNLRLAPWFTAENPHVHTGPDLRLKI